MAQFVSLHRLLCAPVWAPEVSPFRRSVAIIASGRIRMRRKRTQCSLTGVTSRWRRGTASGRTMTSDMFLNSIDRVCGMELRQLEYFIAVADEMNFSRAAQRVHVVQSALSTSVSKLERELGVELFNRSKQQIKITPAGELFRERARRVIQTARLAKDSMSIYHGEL